MEVYTVVMPELNKILIVAGKQNVRIALLSYLTQFSIFFQLFFGFGL